MQRFAHSIERPLSSRLIGRITAKGLTIEKVLWADEVRTKPVVSLTFEEALALNAIVEDAKRILVLGTAGTNKVIALEDGRSSKTQDN